MRLVLHIGPSKTGTTSVQSFMASQREALLGRGVIYPRTGCSEDGNHDSIARQTYGDPLESWKRYGGWKEAIAEIRASGAHTAVVSSEYFFYRPTRDPANLRRLREILSPVFEEITILCYLRRQDERIRSNYLQCIKTGVFDRNFLPRTDPGMLLDNDYGGILDAWASVFGAGRIAVRVFERGQLHPGGLIPDFLAACGIPAAGLTGGDAAERNVSFGPKGVHAMRLANHVLRSLAAGDFDEHGFKLAMLHTANAVLPALRDTRFVGFRHGQAERIMARFEAGNRAVARTYLGRADGTLFREPPGRGLAPGEREDDGLSLPETLLLFDTVLRCSRAREVTPQVFFDTGAGFSERESVRLRHFAPEGEEIAFACAAAAPVLSLRLDPTAGACVVSVGRARAVADDGRAVDLRVRKTNAARVEGGRHCFAGDDPWIVYEVGGPYARFEFALTFHAVGPGAASGRRQRPWRAWRPWT